MDLNSIIRSEEAGNILLVVTAKDLRDLLDGTIAFATKQMQEREENPYYTREQLEQLLHVTSPTLLSYRKKGLIPEPVTINGKVLYNKTDVLRAIESNKLKLKIKKV